MFFISIIFIIFFIVISLFVFKLIKTKITLGRKIFGPAISILGFIVSLITMFFMMNGSISVFNFILPFLGFMLFGLGIFITIIQNRKYKDYDNKYEVKKDINGNYIFGDEDEK